MFDLSGRTALVTGAGRGGGLGIYTQLLAAGAQVLVNDLVPERAVAAATRLGRGATPLAFSVADPEAVELAVASAGPIDILVNNAGIPPSMRPVTFREMRREEWAAYVDVNLFGVLNCVKATIDGMCDRGFGRVITISSGSGTAGQYIGVSLYGAGKGGGISFMRHETTDADRSVTASMARAVPVGRLGTGDDVGYTCVFLASDEASWITGQTIAINGGSLTT